AGHPRAIPLPAAPDVHVPRVARRADRGHDPAVRAVSGGVSRGARDAAGGLRVRRRDGGERAAALGRVGLYEEGDAGRGLGAGHLGGGGLPAGIRVVARLKSFPAPVARTADRRATDPTKDRGGAAGEKNTRASTRRVDPSGSTSRRPYSSRRSP